MKGPFRNKQGSTLLEIVVAIAVLGLMVAPVCSSLVLSHRLNAESEKTLQARLLLESTVEQLMSEGIDESKINDQKYYIVDYAEEATVTILTDYPKPEKVQYEAAVDEDGRPIVDINNNPVMQEIPIELWYNVTVSLEDIEIDTVIKAAPVYVDEAVEGGAAS